MIYRRAALTDLKASGGGLKPRQARGYASVFDNVDSYGDVVVKGAFTDTLKEWADGSRSMPLLYGHDFGDPHKNVGTVISAKEDDHGLDVVMEFDQDPTAEKVYQLVKAGRLSEMSFAFDIVQASDIKDADRPNAVRELQAVKLYECSVVPIGANSEAGITGVKDERDVPASKAGRKLSKATQAAVAAAAAQVTAAMKALTEASGGLKALLPDEDEPEDDDKPVEDDKPVDETDEDDESGKAVHSGKVTRKAAERDPVLAELALLSI